MKIFNSMSQKKEDFIPHDPNRVTMYACGPTVYNYIHVGNARPIIIFDALRRYMEYRGYTVVFAQNFTDVDDKIINRAAQDGVSPERLAEKYIAEYKTDARGLGVRDASVHPRATENIPEIIAIIERLVANGQAYVSGGDVYFRTEAFPEYGRLSRQPCDQLLAGARIDVSEVKENPIDFALWKAAKPGEPYWKSPWGNGRPGWHIECSAMSMKYLGETIDIHCGGADLAFPHHENEIAQSEAASGREFVRYWMHNGFISIDNKKMSKSEGNFFTVREAAAAYGYENIRMFMLMSHYRSPLNYSGEILEQARSALSRLKTFRGNMEFLSKSGAAAVTEEQTAFVKTLPDYRVRFVSALDDDFNTADGISVLFELVRDTNIALAADKSPSKSAAGAALSVFDELEGVL
ncbi:MAG: cysteine--tRNA ligase, partial [Oscillospiraceae bacterium]|nr:cysteine--tRNA ligase [Oscillospiraceae bacterium]